MSLGSGIRDPGSGIRNKPIPDPGSRGQKGPNPGSRIRIRNTGWQPKYSNAPELFLLVRPSGNLSFLSVSVRTQEVFIPASTHSRYLQYQTQVNHFQKTSKNSFKKCAKFTNYRWKTKNVSYSHIKNSL
jgi:hypothetical protein